MKALVLVAFSIVLTLSVPVFAFQLSGNSISNFSTSGNEKFVNDSGIIYSFVYNTTELNSYLLIKRNRSTEKAFKEVIKRITPLQPVFIISKHAVTIQKSGELVYIFYHLRDEAGNFQNRVNIFNDTAESFVTDTNFCVGTDANSRSWSKAVKLSNGNVIAVLDGDTETEVIPVRFNATTSAECLPALNIEAGINRINKFQLATDGANLYLMVRIHTGAASDIRVYNSTNQGAGWALQATITGVFSLMEENGWVDAQLFKEGDSLYAVINDQHILNRTYFYRSQNSGVTWENTANFSNNRTMDGIGDGALLNNVDEGLDIPIGLSRIGSNLTFFVKENRTIAAYNSADNGTTWSFGTPFVTNIDAFSADFSGNMLVKRGDSMYFGSYTDAKSFEFGVQTPAADSLTNGRDHDTTAISSPTTLIQKLWAALRYLSFHVAFLTF